MEHDKRSRKDCVRKEKSLYFPFARGPANDVGSPQAEPLGTMCKGSGQFISMYLEALQRRAPGEGKAECASQTAFSDGLGCIY